MGSTGDGSRPGRRAACGLLLAAGAAARAGAQSAPRPLEVEARIPLGDVAGRIDHLAADVARRRVFVAELGNDTVGVVDLATGRVTQRLRGLHEPQGIAWLPEAELLLVANGGDGTVHRYAGADLRPLGAIPLGRDADNLRLDPAGGGLVWVGHGGGPVFGLLPGAAALTALASASGQPSGASIPLPAHPEGFQLEANGPRAFVNLPRAGGSVAVLDRIARRQIGSWSVPGLGSNYPMALDEAGGRLFVGYRDPAALAVLDLDGGGLLGRLPLGGDTDDLFHDARRRRLYAICGEGTVDVFEDPSASGAAARLPRLLARAPTVAGARTGLFVPALDRLCVAVRAAQGAAAALWVFRPEPT
ncbi:YncE family protein [Paracraurococcus lichenis]|uniref:YncE family protein n=1 Tax=Paracraurococcus lichenis TaxID=3064888 RepID=A0ABT9EBZ3_9PROT|nr:hypothetical protein [Paracraurococcus sp. LOR1-02]MDO9713667.1 hypothetical protein [Paracraurococcus sp. LOR1-02]